MNRPLLTLCPHKQLLQSEREREQALEKAAQLQDAKEEAERFKADLEIERRATAEVKKEVL